MATDPLYAVLARPSAERLRQRLGVGADARVELATTGWYKVVVLFETVAVPVTRHYEFVPAMRFERWARSAPMWHAVSAACSVVLPCRR